MNSDSISVQIRPTPKAGKVKAYADVTLRIPDGDIRIYGCAIVQSDGKPPFVGFPSRPGNIPGKYFPVIELDGDVSGSVARAVLEAYEGFR